MLTLIAVTPRDTSPHCSKVIWSQYQRPGDDPLILGSPPPIQRSFAETSQGVNDTNEEEETIITGGGGGGGGVNTPEEGGDWRLSCESDSQHRVRQRVGSH